MNSIETDGLKAAVRTFVSQSQNLYQDAGDPTIVTAAALELIERLPVARNAVLSYLGRRFDEAANCFLKAQTAKITGNHYGQANYSEQAVYESLSPIAKSFNSMVEDRSWAPQLTKWAVDLLGHISKKLHFNEAAPIAASVNTVEEKLELWLNCSATKILSSITTACFSTIVENGDGILDCIESLLDASIRYAPHFDWVVAHLGSCFPVTIIEQVLHAGFIDFPGPGQPPSPKFSSAIAILGYLTSQHQAPAQKCINKFIQQSLLKPPPAAAAAVSYLLNVGSMSPLVVGALSASILTALNTRNLNQLVEHFKTDVQDLQNLLSVTVHLIERLDSTGYPTLSLLLDIASRQLSVDCQHDIKPLKDEVVTTANCILERLLVDIHRNSTENRILTRYKPELPLLRQLILNQRGLCARLHQTPSNRKTDKVICSLLLAVAWHGGRAAAVNILRSLFDLKRPWAVSTLELFSQHLLVKYPDIMEQLTTALFTSAMENVTVVDNISSFIATGTANSDTLAKYIANTHLPSLAKIYDKNLQGADKQIIQLYIKLVLKYKGTQLSTSSTLTTLTTWFMDLLDTEETKLLDELTEALARCSFVSLSNFSLITGHLLSLTFKHPYSTKLGSTSLPPTTQSIVPQECTSLSQQNAQLQNGLMLAANKSYIQHNQRIGRGLRILPHPVSKTAGAACSSRLISLITLCIDAKLKASSTTPPISPPAYTETDARMLLSTSLLEAVSPDVIASKTQWTDPITYERQLAVRNMLDDHPIIWQLMSICCAYKPCFIALQLLVRCYLASICTSWATQHVMSARNLPRELQSSVTIVKFLIKNDLIPAPLVDLTQLFPSVTTFEMRLLCEIVFRYVQSSLQQGLALVPMEHDDLKQIQVLIQQNIANINPQLAIKFLFIQ